MNMAVPCTCALVIEDQDLMRLALIDEVKLALSHVLVQGIQSLDMALDLIGRQSFDLVLMDPGLPGVDPMNMEERLSVVRRIMRAVPCARHMIVTGFASIAEQRACEALGIAVYVSKNGLDRDALVDILRSVVGGRKTTDVDLSVPFVEDYHYSGFTPREQYIIQRMMARPVGTLKKDVMQKVSLRLDIDEDTVRKYYKSARAKLRRVGFLSDRL